MPEDAKIRGQCPSEMTLSAHCNVHKGFGVLKAQFDTVPRLVSSTIALAISERAAGALDVLRDCVAETRLEIRHGEGFDA